MHMPKENIILEVMSWMMECIKNQAGKKIAKGTKGRHRLQPGLSKKLC